jgi:predicted DNA-binding mobile mystery protein A
MKPEFKSLRIKQLDRSLKPFYEAMSVSRPQRGWLRAVREAVGVPLKEFAEKLGIKPSSAASLEKTEAEYRITLGSLREAADVLGCQLIYAMVPKSGTIQELAERRIKDAVSANVRAVEHSMALEDQAVGNIDEKIREQTDRLLKRR